MSSTKHSRLLLTLSEVFINPCIMQPTAVLCVRITTLCRFGCCIVIKTIMLSVSNQEC